MGRKGYLKGEGDVVLKKLDLRKCMKIGEWKD